MTKQTQTIAETQSTQAAADQCQSGSDSAVLHLTLPTGRIQEKVVALLKQIGVTFSANGRSYKPKCNDSGIAIKLLKAQNIPNLISLGRHDCGFSGGDWVAEQQADVVELLDLQYDPVRIVAAMPEDLANLGRDVWCKRPLIIASEYRRLTSDYITRTGLNAVFLQTFGATEALPPEDADMIIDNTATGTTLEANRLTIVDELMRSTTRFICNRQALEDRTKRQKLEELKMLMQSALRAKEKVLLEMNVDRQDFDKLVANLPCMRAPTISELYNGQGYAIKVAVPSCDVPRLIPQLVALGAKDILEYKLEKIVT
jgi:ATP phosphoribosyltransferase